MVLKADSIFYKYTFICLDMNILRKNRDVLVTLDENGLVRKVVSGLNHSGVKRINAKEMVDREVRALQLLEDISGVQRFVKRESDDTFYTEYMPGKSLLKSPKNSLSSQYFNELIGIIRQCQNRGVYRLGLNRRDFIIGKEGNPGIIDFGNIIFYDDPAAKIPGVIFLAKLYNNLRIMDLKRKYIFRNGRYSK